MQGLDEHTSAKILREARLQQSEVEAEEYPFLASTAGGQVLPTALHILSTWSRA